MAYKRKTWQEKYEDGAKGYPRVEKINGKMAERLGTGTMVIPSTIEVDELMRSVSRRKLTTINNIQ